MHLWDYGINGQGIGKLLLFYAEKKNQIMIWTFIS